MLRSYAELVRRVPLLNFVIESGDAEALETLYKNVRISFVAMFSVNENSSYVMDLIWREAMIQESSNLLSSNGSTIFMGLRTLP
jgi:hypothetical protein